MKKLEEETLNSFLEAAGKKTITEYGRISGIERTRFFRLIHGADMKVKELISLQLYVKEQNGTAVNWSEVLNTFELKKQCRNQSIGETEGILQFERNKRLKELVSKTSKLAA
jgi:hypothetical protein